MRLVHREEVRGKIEDRGQMVLKAMKMAGKSVRLGDVAGLTCLESAHRLALNG